MSGIPESPVAFLIPGQGTPPVEILSFCSYLKELRPDTFAKRLQVAQDQYEQVAKDLSESALFDFTEEIVREDISPAFARTDFTQMMMGVVDSLAVDMALEKASGPILAAGHSYGEIVGAYMTGILPGVEDLMRLSAARGIIMQKTCESSNTALYIVKGLTLEQIQSAGEKAGQLGLYNGPKLILVGDRRGQEGIIREVVQGIDSSVEVSEFQFAAGAFHSNYFKSAAVELRGFIRHDIDTGRITLEDAPEGNQLAMNLGGRLTRTGLGFLDNHITSMTTYIDWVTTLQNLQEVGANSFVVAGPPRTLQGINVLNGLGRITKDLPKYLSEV